MEDSVAGGPAASGRMRCRLHRRVAFLARPRRGADGAGSPCHPQLEGFFRIRRGRARMAAETVRRSHAFIVTLEMDGQSFARFASCAAATFRRDATVPGMHVVPAPAGERMGRDVKELLRELSEGGGRSRWRGGEPGRRSAASPFVARSSQRLPRRACRGPPVARPPMPPSDACNHQEQCGTAEGRGGREGDSGKSPAKR